MVETRYNKLNDYYPIEWIPSFPVEIIKGAILMDQIESRVLLQLKLCNISDKNIFSVHIQVKCFDETGEAVSENNIVHFAFQDLDIPPRHTFGDQQPIFLTDQRVRKVDIILSKVMFTDGKLMILDEAQARKYPNLTPLEHLGSGLVGELKRILPESNKFEKVIIPQMLNDGTWACTCGRLNVLDLSNCVRCGRIKDWQLEKVRAEFLQQSYNEYSKKLEEEQKEQERLWKEQDELKTAEESQRILSKQQKQRKAIWIASLSIVLVTLAYVSYIFAEPRIQFAAANQKLEEGRYDEAKAAFMKLGNFKDSENFVKESDYRQAVAYREKGKYSESITIFNQLGDYRDNSEQAKESIYQFGVYLDENKEYEKAMAQFEQIKTYKDSNDKYIKSLYMLSLDQLKNGKFSEAVLNFEKLGDYKDSKSQLTESYYQLSLVSMKSGDYNKALKALEKIADYKDSKTQIIECKYQIALNLKSNRKELEQAQELFKQLGSYKDSAAKYESVLTALIWQGRWYKLRYDQWVGDRVEFDDTFGPFGKKPFYDYVDIDYFRKKMISFSSIATLNYDFTLSGNTLITDFYGSKSKYILQGNKLIEEDLENVRKNRVTYIREDFKDKEKP